MILLLEHLRNSSLFIGEENSTFLTGFAQCIEDDSYVLAGQIFSLCLFHGGPSPRFLVPQLFDGLIQNPNTLKGSIESIYDLESKQIYESLQKSKYINKIDEVLTEKSKLFELAGTFRTIKNLEEKTRWFTKQLIGFCLERLAQF